MGSGEGLDVPMHGDGDGVGGQPPGPMPFGRRLTLPGRTPRSSRMDPGNGFHLGSVTADGLVELKQVGRDCISLLP